ncbi:MAG: hybrid sensor histidine kinase/response regulator [Desulfamplus sp.]|nr:hybrid sensor histidine kinase/response regulator [Desulfamplus sp.]
MAVSEQIQNRILIVDDNPTNLKVLFEYLSGEKGYKIFIAKNGREALERTANAKPDIILLDIMMPEIDGYETCKRLKEQEETKDIPIIFLTAFADTENKIKAFNRGAVDFIVKPFNQDEVLARIKTHLTIAKQKKELEKANFELAKANASKDKLFSIIAHDMRNKLSGLIGSIELIDSFFNELSDEEKRERIKSMSNTSQQMYKLFENLFTWARMQTGSIEVVTENINVGKIAVEIIDFFRADAANKDISLISDVKEGCDVMYDKNMLNFIIRNLVHNAIKYCDSGNSVTISCSEEGGYHHISVKDTGIGMKKEVCDLLFQVGTKTSKLGTRKEVGSGLGLMVAKEFAELNQGTLSVRSEENVGTEVILSLPASSAGGACVSKL